MRALSRFQLRLLIWGSAALFIIIALTSIIPLVMDQSRLVDWFQQKASIASGRTITIGKISLHLLPRPGFDAERVTIANPAWASAPFIATIDHLSAQFRFASLWQRTFQVASLKADGVVLDFETDASHAGNWQFVSQNTKPNQPNAGHFSDMTSMDLDRVSVRFAREKRDIGRWQLPQVHIDMRPLWRDVNASATLSHAQRTLAINASIDALDTPAHAMLSLKTEKAHISVDARRLQSARVPPDTFAMQLDATRLDNLLAFFDIESLPIVPLRINADVHTTHRHLDLTQIAAGFGAMRIGGSAQLDFDGAQPALVAQLSIARLDWVKMLADAGRPPLPPKPPGELFRTHRLPWHALATTNGMHADIDLHIATLKTRSGVELTNASTQIKIDHGQLQANKMRAQMLGGNVTGTLLMIGADQTAHLKLQLHDVSLHDGLRAMGKTTPMSGGAMQLNAAVTAHGESMKALAASLTGPVTFRIGPTRIITAAGAHSEEMLTGLLPYFSSRDSGEIQLECGSAELPFKNGHAIASPLIGVRSQASELLTRGELDLRAQTIDVRGRVRSRSGFSLGISAFGGDIRFSGPLVHPRAKLDPAGTPGAVARLGAAVATAGLSLLGTAIWDHVNPGANPCDAVFARRGTASAATAKH